jgi:hypothetical protein
LQFCHDVILPEEVQGKTILECGSAFINGSVKPQLIAMGPSRYVGVDLNAGPNVDVVCAVEHLPDEAEADLVVSCELLEHAENWQAAFRRMCALAREALVLTCRGPGFPKHNVPDWWRFTPADLAEASRRCGMIPIICCPDPQVSGVFLKAVRPTGAQKTQAEIDFQVARSPGLDPRTLG